MYLGNKDPVSDCIIFPCKVWTKDKPMITYYCIWDCLAYIYIFEEKCTKFNHCSWKKVFIKYHSDLLYIYRIWDPIDKLIKLATLVKYDESWDIEPISLRQFKQIEESFNIIKPNDFSNSGDKDFLLSDYI